MQVHTVSGGVELRKPESRFVDQYDLKPASLNAAAADEAATADAEESLVDWCKATEDLLAQVGWTG
jgi:dynein heavy chain